MTFRILADMRIDGGGARPLSRDGDAEEFRGDQHPGHASKTEPEFKNGRSSAGDGALERLMIHCTNVSPQRNVAVQSPNLYRDVGRNGEAISPRLLPFDRPPIVWICKFELYIEKRCSPSDIGRSLIP